jgi:hypothetical protein
MSASRHCIAGSLVAFERRSVIGGDGGVLKKITLCRLDEHRPVSPHDAWASSLEKFPPAAWSALISLFVFSTYRRFFRFQSSA